MRKLNEAKPWAGAVATRWALGLAIACLSAASTYATVANGSFSAGLSDWTTQGDVSATSVATLGDNGEIYSSLLQPVALAPGQYQFEFDFQSLMSTDPGTDPSAFPDAFFASLYFINDLPSFDLAGSVFDDAMPLLDVDVSGPVAIAGVLSPSVAIPGWTHYTMDFTNNFSYVIPVFELLDFNIVSGDSAVNLDNVSITQPTGVVPEPATLTLVVLGLVGYLATGKRNAKSL
jgi:hypothetical protein